MTLRVSALDGRVTLTCPGWTGHREAMSFIHAKEAWLRAQTARCLPTSIPALGETIPVFGSPHRIVAGPPGLDEQVLSVRPDRPVPPQVAAILKEAARRRFSDATSRHAALLGRQPGRITLRDTRSRWGSCNARGDLMFSWRLVMAAEAVLDYVAAHEVAHLVRMDHSQVFWDICARLCPTWRDQRDWLRREGAGLHAWRFATGT